MHTITNLLHRLDVKQHEKSKTSKVIRPNCIRPYISDTDRTASEARFTTKAINL